MNVNVITLNCIAVVGLGGLTINCAMCMQAAAGDFRILPDDSFRVIHSKFGSADVTQPVLTPSPVQASAPLLLEIMHR